MPLNYIFILFLVCCTNSKTVYYPNYASLPSGNVLCSSFLSPLFERGLIPFLSYEEVDFQLTLVEEIVSIHLPWFFFSGVALKFVVLFLLKNKLFLSLHGHMFKCWSMRIGRCWWSNTSWQQRGLLPICELCIPYSYLDMKLFAAFSTSQDRCTMWFFHQHW